jgi:serine/threonine protein kinase/formylglycine-generating enzyme required for sulfatase activity
MDALAELHPSEETLKSFALGKLDEESAQSIGKHLEACSDCRERIEEMPAPSLVGRLRTPQDIDRTSSGRTQSVGTAGDRGVGAQAPSPADTLPPGLADHPDYEIMRELGRGGMGVVYLARNKLMGRTEVLKVVSSHLVNRTGVPDRFLAEIRNAAKLEHANVVTAYSAIRLGDSVALAMQYVEGLDLSRLVRSRGPLPVANACNYVYQAALALQHAHEHGMVHRDIKPSNLMLARQGNRAVIKVLDFGLAKVRSEGPTDGTLTHDGQMLGTPDFISPEQIRNARAADIRADIYSLGCTLYYLLTGAPPFRGTSLYDILQAHHSMDARPLNLARPEVPVELAALVAKMMAKEPNRRFQEPKEAARALTPFFKKGVVALQGPGADISQLGQTIVDRPPPEVVSPPAQPATRDKERVVRPKVGAEPSASETQWKSLIDFGETQASRVDEAISAPARRPPPRWLWPSVAAGAVLLGSLIVLGVVLRFRTANGTIELANLPGDAEVFVDGADVAVTLPGGGKPAVITVLPGQHRVMVKKDGIEISGEEVAVQAGGNAKFTVRVVSATEPTPERPKVDALESIENSIGMTLKLVPAGEFLMGSPDDSIEAENDEKPLHRVRITKPFHLGVCEVTQAQYEAVMGNNPSHFSTNGGGKDRVTGHSTDQCPVENVSWFDAIKFCNKLSEKESRKPFYEIVGTQVKGTEVRVPDWNAPGYRLPTEGEWEYACRANVTWTRFSFGDSASEMRECAWFDANSQERTHAVGQKRPNRFGLYDMHGNVSEWCWDWHLGGYYNESRTDDPTGPPLAACRVIRGGHLRDNANGCRSANRWNIGPEERREMVGFRVALGTPERRGPKTDSAGGTGATPSSENSGRARAPAPASGGGPGTPARSRNRGRG